MTDPPRGRAGAGRAHSRSHMVSPMRDDNRAKILRLAADAIDEGGEAAIRVNHLAAAAGVTVPVIYYHFGSREGLVVAAQVERYTRRTKAGIAAVGRAVAGCRSREELRTALNLMWSESLAKRAENRWRRTNVVGSSYARPDLAAAIAAASDEINGLLTEILEPCRERGWFRPGIDLATTVAWLASVLIGRVHVERGHQVGDLREWDRLTLEAVDRAFFGD